MAFVDLAKNKLVLKVIVAGPPAVGKTVRLRQVAEGRVLSFGSDVAGKANMAVLPIDAVGTKRRVEVESYEWHGHEKVDIRAKQLFTGLDGLIYIADAREDRYVDTKQTYEYLMKVVGRSRLIRLPGLLLIGQKDQGLLRLKSFKSVFAHGPTWSQRLDLDLEPEKDFLEALQLFAELILFRIV